MRASLTPNIVVGIQRHGERMQGKVLHWRPTKEILEEAAFQKTDPLDWIINKLEETLKQT